MSSGELSLESTPFLRVTWNIPDFLKLYTESDNSLQSPDFTFADGRYCLRLVSFKCHYIGIQLNVSDTDPGKAVLYDVQLKSRAEEIDVDRSSDKETFRFHRMELENQRHRYVPDGTLTVLCSVRPRKPSKTGSPNSGGDQTQVIPTYRWNSGELFFESPPFLYVTWRIPEFLKLSQQSEYSLESPEFSFCDRRYFLRLFLSGDDYEFVNIGVVNLIDTVPGKYASYEIGLRTTTGGEIYIISCGTSTAREFYFPQRALHIYNYISDGHLIVFCCMRSRSPNSGGAECQIFPRLKNPVPQDATLRKSVAVQTSNEEDKEILTGIAKLQSDYRQLLQKGPDSDTCLVVSGEEFRAHQNILCARSTVFDAMFRHETAEKATGRVVIDDLDSDSFGDFLEYLYTGGVGAGISDDNAFGLYKAADKYDVPTLKAECVAHMRSSLSVDSFCDLLTVALHHPEEELLPQAVTFFKENMARVIVTVKWQQFVIDNGTSANELLIKAVVPPGQ